jgi:hypothetical protein
MAMLLPQVNSSLHEGDAGAINKNTQRERWVLLEFRLQAAGMMRYQYFIAME